MNKNDIERLKVFIADKTTSDLVFNFLKTIYEEAQADTVEMKAAKMIAIEELNRAKKKMEHVVKLSTQEIKMPNQPGM